LEHLHIGAGFCVCYWWHDEIFGWMQAPIVFALKNHNLPVNLVYTNPTILQYVSEGQLIVGIFVARRLCSTRYGPSSRPPLQE